MCLVVSTGVSSESVPDRWCSRCLEIDEVGAVEGVTERVVVARHNRGRLTRKSRELMQQLGVLQPEGAEAVLEESLTRLVVAALQAVAVLQASDQPMSLGPTLSTTVRNDRIDLSTPTCEGITTLPSNCGPSTRLSNVAELHARFSTRRPVVEARTTAYASLERPHASSSGVGFVIGVVTTTASPTLMASINA